MNGICMIGIFALCCVAAYIFMVGSTSSFDLLKKKNLKKIRDKEKKN